MPVYSIIDKKKITHRSLMQTEKSQPSGQRIITETLQTSFLALSIYPRIGMSLSASKTDDGFYLSLLVTQKLS